MAKGVTLMANASTTSIHRTVERTWRRPLTVVKVGSTSGPAGQWTGPPLSLERRSTRSPATGLVLGMAGPRAESQASQQLLSVTASFSSDHGARSVRPEEGGPRPFFFLVFRRSCSPGGEEGERERAWLGACFPLRPSSLPPSFAGPVLGSSLARPTERDVP